MRLGEYDDFRASVRFVRSISNVSGLMNHLTTDATSGVQARYGDTKFGDTSLERPSEALMYV